MKNNHILMISIAIFIGCIILAGGLSLLAFIGAAAYCLFLYNRQMEINADRQKAEIAKMKREAAFCAVPSRHGILSYNAGTVEFWTRQERTAPETDKQITGPEAMQETSADIMPDLLSVILPLDCLMIWGGRGSGKTNFLQHLAREKVKAGEDLWIIDPKPSKPGKWPYGVTVIGHGHNYQEIVSVSERYQAELENRKADFDRTEHFQKVTLIVDELYLLNLKIKGFIDMVLPLLLEGREYNIHMILISQSKTAGSMGLSGKYDLLQCFDAIVGLERQGDKDDPRSYFAYVDFGSGDIEHRTPGKYYPDTTHRHGTNYSEKPTGNDFTADHDSMTYLPQETPETYAGIESGSVARQKPVYESMTEKIICEMFHDGESMNNIAKAVWGSSNGRRTAQIKAVLENYGYTF